MGIQIIPILKAITPLLAASSGIVGSLGDRVNQNRDLADNERIRKLEQDLLTMGKVFSSAMTQLQATAEELRVLSELNETREARLRQARVISIVAVCIAVAAILIAILT